PSPEMVRKAGRGGLPTYQRIEAGNHTDGLVDEYPDRLAAIGPRFVEAVRSFSRGPGPVRTARQPPNQPMNNAGADASKAKRTNRPASPMPMNSDMRMFANPVSTTSAMYGGRPITELTP